MVSRRGAGEGAVTAAIECLDVFGRLDTALVAGETSGRLAAALRARDISVNEWLLTAGGPAGVTPSAWPGPQRPDAAFIRMPKAKDVLDMMLHAAAERLPPGAHVVLFGDNDQGVKSAEKRLSAIAGGLTTLAAKRHARVIGGRRLRTLPEPKGKLADWRRETQIRIGGQLRSWASYPGAFAKGGLDDGTRLLMEHLPDVSDGARVLDFAAGTGVIAAAVLDSAPGTNVTMLETDLLALEAAGENVAGATAVLGHDLRTVDGAVFDVIVSNPPIHDGVMESRAVLDRLIAEAPKALRAGGELRIVVQRRIGVMKEFKAAFGACDVIADDGRFTVLSARKAGSHHRSRKR
ncbi:MAG: methyltransferase [Hyphomicrobiaceae bacterium]